MGKQYRTQYRTESAVKTLLLTSFILSAPATLAFDGVMVAKSMGLGSNIQTFCAVGKLATGGGCSGSSHVIKSHPICSAETLDCEENAPAIGWSCTVDNPNNDNNYAYANCIDVKWQYCATESYGSYCTFEGTKVIKYGIDNRWIYKTYTDSVECINQHFGDPAVGLVKACYVVE
ncbi:hypothetical protein [uncultured Shewanella sp.]|uniref:hypothetical protein n=1 Tax=uncultured Shewanella sp. TaxID=173975 RepID=UPI00262014D3|nr:hypothetical protein [uncultured Shewanella sp.]